MPRKSRELAAVIAVVVFLSSFALIAATGSPADTTDTAQRATNTPFIYGATRASVSPTPSPTWFEIYRVTANWLPVVSAPSTSGRYLWGLPRGERIATQPRVIVADGYKWRELGNGGAWVMWVHIASGRTYLVASQ